MTVTTKLTLDSIRYIAPAIFATQPHPKLSDKYRFYSTAQIIEPMLEEDWFLSRFGQAKARGENYDYTTHYVALTRPDLILNGEHIEALIFNSHDGRRKFSFELGVYRAICANGCVWSDASFGKLHFRHLAFHPQAVRIACDSVSARAAEVIEQIDIWKHIELDAPSRVKLASYALALRWPKNPPICAGDLLFIRREEDEAPTLWNTFNRVQENLIKGGVSYAREGGKQARGTTREIISIGLGLAINKALWEGARCIAEGLALPA